MNKPVDNQIEGEHLRKCSDHADSCQPQPAQRIEQLSLTGPSGVGTVAAVTGGTSDFVTLFDGCETAAEADCLYKRLFKETGLDLSHLDPQTYQSLSDAHRRTHERFVVRRQAVEEENAWRHDHGFPLVNEVSNLSLDDMGVTSSEVRAWAVASDIEIPLKGRIHPAVLAEYAKANNIQVSSSIPKKRKKEPVMTSDTNYGASENANPATTPSASEVRVWALENGIPVGKRGRVHPDLVAKYIASKEG